MAARSETLADFSLRLKWANFARRWRRRLISFLRSLQLTLSRPPKIHRFVRYRRRHSGVRDAINSYRPYRTVQRRVLAPPGGKSAIRQCLA